uniref:Uncharacterized protein n=1 Tax=Craspedostauros australis TaxID=1486917 RepID=A0A7R9ZLS5_9STRA
MPQSSKDKSLDNSGKGKDRRSGKSASSSSLSNRSAGRPREITTTTMRSGGNGTSSSNSHSNNHSSSPQNRIPDSLPAGPFASPRHDPDAVLVKKKKKGWMRGPKKFIKNMKRYAQEETDENETVQARA